MPYAQNFKKDIYLSMNLVYAHLYINLRTTMFFSYPTKINFKLYPFLESKDK